MNSEQQQQTCENCGHELVESECSQPAFYGGRCECPRCRPQQQTPDDRQRENEMKCTLPHACAITDEPCIDREIYDSRLRTPDDAVSDAAMAYKRFDDWLEGKDSYNPPDDAVIKLPVSCETDETDAHITTRLYDANDTLLINIGGVRYIPESMRDAQRLGEHIAKCINDHEKLLAENADLHRRLAEAEKIIETIDEHQIVYDSTDASWMVREYRKQYPKQETTT